MSNKIDSVKIVTRNRACFLDPQPQGSKPWMVLFATADRKIDGRKLSGSRVGKGGVTESWEPVLNFTWLKRTPKAANH
jgi:hypothetical protein